MKMTKKEMLAKIHARQEFFHDDDIAYLLDLVENQPEIIRCKDCKYYNETRFLSGESYGFCCDKIPYERKKDDFCSKAVKRVDK